MDQTCNLMPKKLSADFRRQAPDCTANERIVRGYGAMVVV